MAMRWALRRRRERRRFVRDVRRARESLERLERMAASRAREALLRRPEYRDGGRLPAWGYKAFSQGDEDGILAEIFRRVGTTGRSFVEIGVGNGLENNTTYLLSQGWRGAWIEADPENLRRIRRRFASVLEEGRLTLVAERVDRENAGKLLAELALPDALDLLSVDVDGNDYHVLEALEPLRTRVLVAEYNPKFPPPVEWVMRYDPEHRWDETDYYGASLAALERLLRRRGFALVGCSLTGQNAFFVRRDLAEAHFPSPYTPEHHYEPSRDWILRGLGTGHPPGFGAAAPPGEVRRGDEGP